MTRPPKPWTRDELKVLIAGALRRSVTYMSQRESNAAADTVLREMRAAKLRISGPRRAEASEGR